MRLASGSMFKSSPTSAKRGVAPANTMEEVEATNELGGVRTSQPSPMGDVGSQLEGVLGQELTTGGECGSIPLINWLVAMKPRAQTS